MMLGAAGLSRLLAASLLGAIAVQNYATTHASADLHQYRARIRQAAERIPARIGPWVGQDVPVPTRAVTTLRPNVLISRRYVNVETGLSAGLMLVHCNDAHHMVGHYPLRCYPAEGWRLVSSRPHDWQVGDLRLSGTKYEFDKQEIGGQINGEQRIIVVNCLFRPGGLVLRDMESLSDSIIGAGGQASGAGQIQVYFDAAVPEAVRDSTVQVLVAGYRPVIDAILSTPDAKSK
jgi:Protein of unknown function (DUF3485)